MSTIKHQPATALPWKTETPEPYCLRISAPQRAVAEVWLDDAPVHDYNAEQHRNAAYIAHAANAYPKLVEALREAAAGISHDTAADRARARAAYDLLAELGEAT